MNKSFSVLGLSLSLLVAACSKTDFASTAGSLSTKSDEVAAEDSDAQLLQEADENPDVVLGHSCGPNRVLICHVPSDQSESARTLCVNQNAIPAHLAHETESNEEKDMLGACEEEANKKRCAQRKNNNAASTYRRG